VLSSVSTSEARAAEAAGVEPELISLPGETHLVEVS
jgi:hypothetical protein